MKRVLIIGSSGFIGRSLAAALSTDGEVTVTGFGRTPASGPNGNIRFLNGSFEDSDALTRALQDQDIVYHLISQSIPSSSWDNPSVEIEKNLTPSIKLIELAAAAGVKKICFASSGGTVYGPSDSPLNEESPTDPFSPYGIVKRAFESFLVYAKHRFGINYDIYRISNAYGEGQDVSKGLGFINTALENIVYGRAVVIYGDGETVRDFIHVRDVGKLLALNVNANLYESNVFNLSSGHAISLNELLTLIRTVVEIDFRVEYKVGRLNDNKKVMLENTRIMSLAGDLQLTNLKDGVREAYNHIKKRSLYVEKIVR
jgi:UDP-glucose 4-epimerase